MPRKKHCRAAIHGAAALFDRAATLGATKSVSFKNKKIHCQI
jgi:hypothetical protein